MGRDPVNNFFIDTCAGGSRKCWAASVLMRIVFEERLGVAEAKVFGDDCIDLSRGHSRGHDLAHELMRLPDTDAGLTHEGDFAFGFKLNHGELRVVDESTLRRLGQRSGAVSTQNGPFTWALEYLDNLIKRGNYWRTAGLTESTALRTLAKTSSGVPEASICRSIPLRR